MDRLTALSSFRQVMDASFEMPALTRLPLEEVLPGKTVSGLDESYLNKLPGILSTVLG